MGEAGSDEATVCIPGDDGDESPSFLSTLFVDMASLEGVLGAGTALGRVLKLSTAALSSFSFSALAERRSLMGSLDGISGS